MINFGSQEEFDEFVAAQQEADRCLVGSGACSGAGSGPGGGSRRGPEPGASRRPGRASIEEIRTEAR